MNKKYNWHLEEIFKNKEEFNEMKNLFKQDLEEIKKFEGILCKSSDNLYNCHLIYEKALEKLEKLYSYGMLFYHLDMAKQEGIKLFKEVEGLSAELQKSTAFITPEITYADTNIIKDYLEKDVRLNRYERIINEILEDKKHILSKEEENLLANYTEVFSAPENTFDILTNAEFKFGDIVKEDGQTEEMTDSTYSLYLHDKNENIRKQAFNLMYDKYKEFINTITELYLSNVKTTSINAKLRKYKSSLEKAVKKDDASLKVYNSLIETINKNIQINHDFIEIKKKLLDKSDFHMYDLYVNPFNENKDEIEFEEARKEVEQALKVMGKEYSNKIKEAFDNDWIDVYAKPNKRGGAYSMGVYGVHPFVLLNFVKNKRDVSTIAHELGHSMHSYYSNSNQNVIDSNYTIMVAEVASTVNEIILSDYQVKKEKDKKKKAELIYELLEMIRATLFRQSMFAEFEKIVHDKIEKQESLASEDLNNIYYQLNEKYFGSNMIIDKQIQYEWARIPHFYTDFYVYKYATGISAAISIASNILSKGESFVEKYINMLKQGCSKKSIDLLKMVDVDLEDTAVYQNAMDFYKNKIEELKALI